MLQSKSPVFSIAGACAVTAVLFVVILKMKNTGQNKPEDGSQADRPNVPEQKSAEEYSLITERIRRVENKYKSILFAGANLSSLPVTIPVNVAIELAKQNKRCLLIDLDLKRNSIAEAFEVASQAGTDDPGVKAFRTELKNLWILPAHHFTKLRQMNIKPIVSKALEKFDFVLINAPHLKSSPDRRQIASSAQAALIFSESAQQATNIAALIKNADCALIANIQIP